MNSPEKITLSEAMDGLREKYKDNYRRINTMLLAVFHMMQISDKLFAEIEDILESQQDYKFDIKRKHKSIAKQIHEEYMPLFNRLHGSELCNMYEDNVELEDVIKVWMGLEQGRKVIVQELPTDGEAVTASLNPIGDIFLRNGDGWQIQIPKAFQECLNIESSVLKGIEEGNKVPCGLRIYVGKEIDDGVQQD